MTVLIIGLLIIVVGCLIAMIDYARIITRKLDNVILFQQDMEEWLKRTERENRIFTTENFIRLRAWHKEYCSTARGKSLTSRLDERVEQHVTSMMMEPKDD